MKITIKGNDYKLKLSIEWYRGGELFALEETLSGIQGVLETLNARVMELKRYETEEEGEA